MFRLLIVLLAAAVLWCSGCKEKPKESGSSDTGIKVENLTKENMQTELDNLEKQIEQENVQ